jgi:hypothetical protein
MRIGGGAGGVLVGLYLSDLANGGHEINARLVGTLGAMSFGAELVGAIPMEILADVIPPRALMTAGGAAGQYIHLEQIRNGKLSADQFAIHGFTCDVVPQVFVSVSCITKTAS